MADKNILMWIIIIGIVATIFLGGMFTQKQYPLFSTLPTGEGYCTTKKINITDAEKLEKLVCSKHPSSNWNSIEEVSLNLYHFDNWNNNCCDFDFLISGNQGIITNNYYVSQGLCLEPPDVSDLLNFFGCGTCTSNCLCNIPADTDCNNSVSDTEILSYITKWVNSQITDSQVLAGIQAWISS